ncbi:MAG: tetratricopeptide repeat protein [Planctomycetes bacterium]|nr:tetratricopeptide repeat protein [Planctomycetota bacterium]
MIGRRASVARALVLPVLWLSAACGDDVADGVATNGDEAVGGGAGGAQRARFDLPIAQPIPGDASRAATHVALALREIGLGHPDEAKRELKSALEADPANLTALLLRGDIGMQKTFAYEPLLALSAYRAARLVDPRNAAAKVGEACARVALEDDVGAAPLLQELADDDLSGRAALRDEQRALMRRSKATLALRAGRFDEALLEVERALHARTSDRMALALRAEIFERMKRPEDALTDLEMALAMRGDDPSLHFAASRVLRRLGRTEDAARHQRAYDSLRLFEEDASTAFREDFPRRIALRRELIAAWPEWKRGRHLLVRELLGGNELAEAMSECDALLTAQAGDVEAWFLKSKVLCAQGDFAGARDAADRMIATGKVAPPVRDELLREIEKAANGGK